ncbi:transcription elongation factor GreAB [Rhizobium sp. KVB221]|uniref:Transcription elongation factor GreAB n=1 Tax=Rhizobium setariae TaxID=2801340 RepID=A0A937CJF3_9HYPH|nr:transcription elongation factor GreAB [Rhizobium setariae]MBL0371045.1 transcription elongation factor GreAB [Rhizobium setariae]
MSREAFCRLTAGDVSVLLSMLEHYSEEPSALTVLLRRKLAQAGIFFREDIQADVVTLDSRVLYSLDGQSRGPRLLVRSAPMDLPPFALSVHSIEGLALLGLAEGEAIEVDPGDGAVQVLTVEKVLFQPEAAERTAGAKSEADMPDDAPNVVSFRRQRPLVFHVDPDNDPGPTAA